jgi:hypothetical protein
MPWLEWCSSEDWLKDGRLHLRGPACYELGVSDAASGKPEHTVYVGETGNARSRLREHIGGKSQLQRRIAEVIASDKTLWLRVWPVPSKDDAKALQDGLLATQAYPWNGYSETDRRARVRDARFALMRRKAAEQKPVRIRMSRWLERR